jgi:hypothetical protein
MMAHVRLRSIVTVVVAAMLGLSLNGCDRSTKPKQSASRNGGSAKLPPRPMPVSSAGGSKAADAKAATEGGHGGPGDGSKPSGSPVPSGFRGSVATISLPPPPLAERHDLLAGWIDLFNGVTLTGWTRQSNADWSGSGGRITVGKGDPGLLTTNMEFGDYHLRVDFRTLEKDVNSGVFLHTVDAPGKDDVAKRCYEINIAPDSNPFPTGSIVARAKSNQSITEMSWHSLEAKVQEGRISIFVDGSLTAEYDDPRPLRRGKIGLQFNNGPIEFRTVKLRPLGLGLFGEGGGQAGWKLDPKGKSALEIGIDGDFRLRGGKGYLESEKTFKDFVLQVECRTNRENQNSGIFFRTIPGSEMDGYECQINNAEVNGEPVDYGTGGIFNRQKAMSMPAPEGKWFALTIICQGSRMGCWVNGTQVSDWNDDRPEDPNPRKGKRLDAGTIQLQGHDPKTDVNFRLFRIGEIAPRVEPDASS